MSGNIKFSLITLVFFLNGCAQNAEIFNAHLTYYPSENVASIVPSQKQAILFLSVEDNRKNVQSGSLLPGLPGAYGKQSAGDLSLDPTVTRSISDALKAELNLLGIQLMQDKNHAQAHIKATIKKIHSSEEGMFGPFLSVVDIDVEVIRLGQSQPILKESLHGEHEDDGQGMASAIFKKADADNIAYITGLRTNVLNKAFAQAIGGLRQSLEFKKVIVDLAVYSPEYLAKQKVLAQIKAELIPLNSKFRVATDSAAIRKMPRTDSEVIKEIGIGSIIQIIGKLPSGWMQVAREGESIGWIHGDSVATDSTFTPPNQQQAQAEKKPTPQSGTGSGFFVSKMGHVITNAHVVQSCNKVTIGDNANKQVPAELINTDRSNDLALLKLSTLEMASAESKSLIQKLGIVIVPLASKGLLRSEDVRLGEKVLVAGYPFGDVFSNTIKVTSGIVSATRGAGDDSGQFQLDAAVQPGNSGGPIYDSSGNIVGVVISQLDKLKVAKAIGSLPENVNFGIKASTVRQFLISSGVPSKKSERTEEKSTEQLAEIAKNQALMVMCLQTESFEQTAESIAEEREKLKKERERIAALQNLQEEKQKLEEERRLFKEEQGRLARLQPKKRITFPPKYNQALHSYRSGNYDECILLLQSVLSANPPERLKDNINYWIGSCYSKLEMYEDAIEILQSTLLKNPPAELRNKILKRLNEIDHE